MNLPTTSTLTRRQKLGRTTGKLIRQIQHDARMRLDERLKGSDITSAQVRLLDQTRQRPGITGAQLARALSITPQSVQAMLTRAVQQGWMLRGVNPENSRLVAYRVSASGLRLLEQAEILVRELEVKVWAGISIAEMQAMIGVLERCQANLSQ